MYMLGLCYRNGYGVDANQPQAMYWLQKAAKKNIKPSHMELESDSPERPLQPKMLKIFSVKEDEAAVPAKFTQIKHEAAKWDNLNGVYTGVLVTYDWSGQYILEENPLKLIIEQQGDEIIADWQQEGATPMEAYGMLTDSALVFTKDNSNKTLAIVLSVYNGYGTNRRIYN